jgi:K+-sensing histidine kinase KdpD
MNDNQYSLWISPQVLLHSLWTILAVAATTAILFLIGRSTLGEAVIALLYLLPIGWATAKWGQVPGICGAVSAALAFDFFFIPPFYTFTVGRLEGWLVLVIFLAVAVLIVGRIQSGLSQAQAREREATFMYELSAMLAGLRTQEAVARALANFIQQTLQAELVQVGVISEEDMAPIVISAPNDNGVRSTAKTRPDKVVPLLAAREMAGEIRIWRGKIPLPCEDSHLLRSFATQGALALERARLDQTQAQRAVPEETVTG